MKRLIAINAYFYWFVAIYFFIRLITTGNVYVTTTGFHCHSAFIILLSSFMALFESILMDAFLKMRNYH
ncbi:hypothetical protein ACFVRR_17250 [Gottfriedia sp. NPDC057948]|uniref:hypothetical protein n=1 Tax=Gottfriedia sp. NPDC057948 TaxID=3346287 RepID=UPI0036DAE55D